MRVLGWILAVGFVPVALLSLASSPSLWGLGYAAALFGIFFAMIKRARKLVVAALAVLLMLTIGHASVADTGGVRLTTTASESRTIDRVIDERDIALMGTRAIFTLGLYPDADGPRVFGALRDGYDRMQKDVGTVPSPFVATYLGLEAPTNADVLSMGPDDAETTLVFLHGFAGAFTLPCWEIGHVAREKKMRTVCPATTWRGQWWTSDGERIVRAVVESERKRGAKRIFISGLSNGGIGLSRLLPRMPNTFAGAIFISGIDSSTSAASVPSLVFQGSKDYGVPASNARSWASKSNAKYVEVDAGHFAMLVEHDRFEQAVREFLSR